MALQGHTAKTPLPLEKMLLAHRDVSQVCSRDPQHSRGGGRCLWLPWNHQAKSGGHLHSPTLLILQPPGLPSLYQLL